MARNKFKILVVDDDDSVAQCIMMTLDDPAREIARACDGAAAVAEVEATPFDLVITDNNMPRINGPELVRRLRDMKFPGKIMVLSAYLSDELGSAYEALGVDAVVSKPFDVRELCRSVEQLVAA